MTAADEPVVPPPELRHDNRPAAFAALEQTAFDTPWKPDDFRDGPDRFHLSLWRERQCLAYVYGSRVLDEVEIWRIATLPVQRGQGLGGRLLAALIQESRSRQAKRIFLEVDHRNEAALALYRKFGFRERSRRLDYYGPQCHALLLALDL